MSLLMQALKKAERAKQNSAHEEELDKPSEAFDEILALTPEPAPVPAAAAAPLAKRELSLDLEPMAEFSLEPMAADAPAASLTPRPSPSPLPAHSDHKEPGLTLDLAPDPSAPAAPTTQPAATAAAQITPPTGARPAAPAATAYPGAAGQPYAPAAGPSAAAGNPAGAARASAKAAKSDPAGKPRGAARARAAAATSEPSGMDPERMRLIGLIALLVLIVGGFGFYYWQAVMAPGAGSRLPPVPMPPLGATGATPVQVIGANPAQGPGAGYADTQGLDPSGSGMLAPSSSRAGREDLERRLARTEQDLAAAQQAIQSQLNTPRVDQLPPVAAQDSGEIRVARAVQPSHLSPALEGAYQAFNSGDLASAQQQYETALRQDANNRDTLLGLATLSARQNQGDKAASYYLRLLELDPSDAAATAGLIGLRHGDAGQSESRLKAALANNPEAAPVLFALGNLYAQQGRWSEAQQAYFRAFSSAPDNPDYAYNLAIGLDRLNQGKLALTYYQRALALAQDKAAAFDRNALRKRMHELGAAAR
ncbi:tetratricopeptide repeat protein [Duganella sp. CT11-25]|uniref:tetratricopeptide repeat protein n=1 Tax=Duganella sp. CT11-25 TaxID=3243027 RepID=UPI0039B08C42